MISEPLGFLNVTRARSAQRVIGRTEHIVNVLQQTPTDLAPAEAALHIAKKLYAAREYADAIAHAKRARNLAMTLNERFNAYTEAWMALQVRLEELKRVGLPTERLEAVLGLAEEKVVAGIEEEGAVVPNYLEAKAALERAADEGRDLLARANQASNKILRASLAVEAFSDLLPRGTPSWTVIHFDEMIELATRELALGYVDVAARVASEVETFANRARSEALRTRGLLDEAEATLREVRATGAAEGLRRRIEATRDSLVKGLIDPATSLAVARNLRSEAISRREGHLPASSVLEDAAGVYVRLQQQGFHSFEVEATLDQARRALTAGDIAAVKENVRRASETFVHWRRERTALAKGISNLHGRIAGLRGREIPFMVDIQEVLGRAEREFQAGSLAGAREDLLIATVLLSPAPRIGG